MADAKDFVDVDFGRLLVDPDGFEIGLSPLGKGEVTAVRLRTGSAEAVLTLNGVVIGTGKTIVLRDIGRGRYPVELVAPGLGTATGRLDVSPGGRTRLQAVWVDEGERGRDRIEIAPPLVRSWVFWTAVGGGALLAGGATAAIVIATQPEPQPEGEVSVPLP